MSEVKIRLNQVFAGGRTVNFNPITVPDSIEIDNSGYDNFPEGNSIESLDDLLKSMGDLAFEDGIDIPEATTEQSGVVKLSHAINDTTDPAKALAASSYGLGMMNEKVDEFRGDFEEFKETVNAVLNSIYNISYEEDEHGNTITNYGNGISIGGVITLTNLVDAQNNNILDIQVNTSNNLINFPDGIVIGDLLLKAVWDDEENDYVLDIDTYNGTDTVSATYPYGLKIKNLYLTSSYNNVTDEYVLDVTSV